MVNLMIEICEVFNNKQNKEMKIFSHSFFFIFLFSLNIIFNYIDCDSVFIALTQLLIQHAFKKEKFL